MLKSGLCQIIQYIGCRSALGVQSEAAVFANAMFLTRTKPTSGDPATTQFGMPKALSLKLKYFQMIFCHSFIYGLYTCYFGTDGFHRDDNNFIISDI